jgi:2-iminobutanoate/2-iminopropanoate deaminase
MPKQAIQTDKAGPPLGAYSQGIRAGDFVFVTGCGPIDPATGEVRGETVEEQTDLVISNIEAILEAGGATLAVVFDGKFKLLY